MKILEYYKECGFVKATASCVETVFHLEIYFFSLLYMIIFHQVTLLRKIYIQLLDFLCKLFGTLYRRLVEPTRTFQEDVLEICWGWKEPYGRENKILSHSLLLNIH
jgi:hypothetical protein